MHRVSVAIGVLAVLVCPLKTARADSIAYVRTSTQLERESNPSTYHPLNLLDDDPNTVWCEGADNLGEGEEIRFFFKKAQRIDRIVISPAASTGRLVQSVRVSDGTNSVVVHLEPDSIAERPLKRPLSGSTFTVTIEEVGGPNEGSSHPDDVACLADVLLYFGRLPFGGRTPANKLRYDKRKDQILGRWAAAPLGAPEAHIIFALDGTWEWTYTPLLGGRSETMRGEYRFRGNRLLMRRGETGRWSDMRFKHRRIKVDPDEIGAPLGDYSTFTLNSALGKKIEGEYNNAVF